MADVTTIGALVRDNAIAMGDGYRTKRPEHGLPGYRIIRVADVREGAVFLDGDDYVSEAFAQQIGSKVAQAGDVLLTTKGTVGRVAIMPASDELAVYSPQLCYFRVHDQNVIDSRYLRYWFSSLEFLGQSSFLQGNTDMAPYISLSDLRSIKMTLPAVVTQRAVAEVLGALDDKIGANAKLASTAEALARTIASAVPATVPLGEIVEHIKTTVNPEGLADDSVAHFSLPAFDAGIEPEVVGPQEIKSNKFLVGEPSVLVSKLNPRFLRVWNIPTISPLTSLASTEFVTLRPRFSSTTVLWALTSQPAFGSALEAMVAGTSGSHQRVKPAEMLSTLVPDPRVMSDVLVGQIDALGLRAILSRDENRTLAATRDALLPQLMSGKLRVKDAERIVSEVA